MDKASNKGKKKHVKDELNRQKQAEKKRRRLEKALANSAAIRTELEKKKEMKKEELRRLDEQSAAIAEAVALHVLSGEDDTEVSHRFLIDNERRLYSYRSFEFAPRSYYYEKTCEELMASLRIAENEGVDGISDDRAASFGVGSMFDDCGLISTWRYR